MTPKKKLPIRDYQLDEKGMMGVYAMSLVDIPAIEVDFVAMSQTDQIKLQATNEERRMVYGPALIPDQLIYRIDPETNEEYYARYSSDVIRQVAQRYMKMNQHHNATVMHQVPVAGITTVETWMKEGQSDKSVELGISPKLPVGTWFIGQLVEDDTVWNDVKSGVLKGFSIEAYFQWEVEQNKHSELFADLAELEKLLDNGIV